MADFMPYKGSLGVWSADKGSLTITLGEMAQLLLVGGGPKGQEKLNVAYDGVINSTAVQEFPWETPDQRLFCITPPKAGDGRIVARLPNNGPPYTRTIQLVVLPRKASSLGAESIIVWGKGTGGAEWLSSVQEKALKMSPPALAINAPNVAEFVKFLTTFRDTGRRIGQMEVNTHGAPGQIGLGQETLGTAKLLGLQDNGYESVFAPNARVFFGGCNVAEGRAGIEFLKAFGRTFLYKGGGSVGGSTSVGFSTRAWVSNGKQYHLWGTTRRLYFNSLGRVEKSEGIDNKADLEFLRG